MNLDSSVFTEQERIIGYLGTDSGGILLTDAIWETALPATTLQRISIDLNIPSGKIPVVAGMRNGKRFLIIDIDSVQINQDITDNVQTEDRVKLPKEQKDEEG